MVRSGLLWHLPSWATGRRAWELLAMINPLNHGRSPPEEIEIYKVEPYVVAADVYGVSRTAVVVDGHGIRDRPAGCTGLYWNHSWG